MCGDWQIYLDLLTRGSISYTVSATNYFRRHGSSVVAKIEGTDIYFRERATIAHFVSDRFSCNPRTISRLILDLEIEWKRFNSIKKDGTTLDSYIDRKQLVRSRVIGTTPKVGFYVHGMMFSHGGIEHLCAQLAKYLVAMNYSVVIYCRVSDNARPVYDVGSFVEIRPVFDELNIEDTCQTLRRAIADDGIEIFVPMLSEHLFESIIEAAFGLCTKIIASEHNDPWEIERRWWSHERRLKTFAKCDAIHLLLPRYSASLSDELKSRVRIIPNGVEPIRTANYPCPEPPLFIAVGRLSDQKRFDRLIKAMPIVMSAFPKAELHIFGEGPNRQALSELSAELGLIRNVFLRGHSNRIPEEMSRSTAFVMSSEFEGLPITLLEAKGAGIPTIAYDCNGIKDLIADGKDGYIVNQDDNGENLAAAMITLLKDQKSLKDLRTNAKLSSSQFHIREVAQKWKDLLLEIYSA